MYRSNSHSTLIKIWLIKFGFFSSIIFGLLFFLALVGAAFTLVFAIAGLVALLRCLGGDYGSQALGTHRKESRYAGSTDVVWMTPKEARNKGLIS